MSLPMNGLSDEELGITPPKPLNELTDADLGIQGTPSVTNPGVPINLTDPNKTQLGNLLAGMTPSASPVQKPLSDAELGLSPQGQLPGYGGARKQSAQSLDPSAPTVGLGEATWNGLKSSWYGGNKDEVYAELTKAMAVKEDALRRLEELNSQPDAITSRINRGMRDLGDVPQTPFDAMMQNPAVERKALQKVVADMDAMIPGLQTEYQRLHQIVDVESSGRTLGYKNFQKAMQSNDLGAAASAFWGDGNFLDHLGNMASLGIQGAAESAWPSAKAAIVDIGSTFLPGGKLVQGVSRVGGTFAQTGKDASEGEVAQQIQQWLTSKGVNAEDPKAIQEFVAKNPKEFLAAYEQAKSTGLRVGGAEGGITAFAGLVPGAGTTATIVNKNPVAGFFKEGAKKMAKEFFSEAAEESAVAGATGLARDGTVSGNQIIGSGLMGGASGSASAGSMHLLGGAKDAAVSPFRKDQTQQATPQAPPAGQPQATPAPAPQATPAPQAAPTAPTAQGQTTQAPQENQGQQESQTESKAPAVQAAETEVTTATTQAQTAQQAFQDAVAQFGPESQEAATASIENDAAAKNLEIAQQNLGRANEVESQRRAKEAAKNPAPAAQEAPAAPQTGQPTQTYPQTQTQPQDQAQPAGTPVATNNVEPGPESPSADATLEQRQEWVRKYDAWKEKYGKTHWLSGKPKPAAWIEGTPEFAAREAKEQAENQARATQPQANAQPSTQATAPAQTETQPQATQPQAAPQTAPNELADIDDRIKRMEASIAGTKSPAKLKEKQAQLDALKKKREQIAGQQATQAQPAPEQSVMPTDAGQQNQQTPQPEQKKGTLEQLELDIDDQIRGFRGGLNDVTSATALTALYAAKGAVKLAKGVRDKAVWTAEMIKEFGEEIKPHIEKIWSRAQQLTDAGKIRSSVADLLKPRVKVGDATKQEIGHQFSTRNAAAPEGVLDHSNPEHQAVMASTIADEVEDQMKRTKADVEWYEKSILRSIQIANKILGGALDKKENEFIYKLMLALNSNGQAVMPNTERAVQQTELWLKTGKFDTESTWGGDAAPAINGSLRIAQELISKIGVQKFSEFLRKKQTVAEVNAFMKANGYPDFKTGGMNMGDQAVGSHIFGPKIGSFFANVDGNTDPVTMDTWFTRAMNRIAGNLTLPSVSSYPAQIQRILDEAKNAGVRIPKEVRDDAKNVLKLLRQMEKMTPEDRAKINPYDIIKKDSPLYNFANAIFKAYEKSGWKKEGDKNNRTAKDKLNLASKALIENAQNFDEAPGSGGQRANFLNIIKQASEILKARGLEMNNAAIQAVWWGREKMLWDHLGQRRALGQNEAFDLAAEAIYKEKFGKPSGVMDGDNQVAQFADTNSQPQGQANSPQAEIDEVKAILKQMAGKPMKTSEAVAFIKNKLKGKALSQLAQENLALLEQIAKSSKADFPFKWVEDRLRVTHPVTGQTGTVGGFFHPRSGVIEISIPLLDIVRASNDPWGRMAYIMAHEIVHSHTMEALQTDWMFKSRVKQLLKSVRTQMEAMHGPDYMKKVGMDIAYGLSNEAEFLAEGMTNREFQKLLASIQTLGGKSYGDEVRGLMQIKASNQNYSESTRKGYQKKISAFDSLKSAVVAALSKMGIQVNKNTILEEIASLYTDAAIKQTKNDPDKNSRPYYRDRFGFDKRSDTTYFDITGHQRPNIAPKIEEDEQPRNSTKNSPKKPAKGPKDREHLRGFADDALRDLFNEREANGEKVTAADVLDTIANADSEFSPLAKALLERGDSTSLDREVTRNDDASGGHWQVNAEGNQFGPKADERIFVGTEQDVERTAIEEIVHALTATKVPDDMQDMFARIRAQEDSDTYVEEDVQEIVAKQYVKYGRNENWRRICEAWLALREEAGPEKASAGYRTRDLFEFLPGLVLNPQDVGEVLSKLKSKLDSGWFNSFIEAVRQIFGFSKKQMDSLFGTAMRGLEGITEQGRTMRDDNRDQYAYDVFNQDMPTAPEAEEKTSYVAGYGATDDQDREARIREYEDAIENGTPIWETRAIKSFLEDNGLTVADVQQLTLEEFVNAQDPTKPKTTWHEEKPDKKRKAIVDLYNKMFKTGKPVAFIATHGTSNEEHLRTRAFSDATLGDATSAPSAGEGHFLSGTQFTSGTYGSGGDPSPIRLGARGQPTAEQYNQDLKNRANEVRSKLRDLAAFWHGLFPGKEKDRYPGYAVKFGEQSYSLDELIDSTKDIRDKNGQTVMGGVFDTSSVMGNRYSSISSSADPNKTEAQKKKDAEMARNIAAKVLADFPDDNVIYDGSPFHHIPVGLRQFYQDIADGVPYSEAREKLVKTIRDNLQERLQGELKGPTPYNQASGIIYMTEFVRTMMGLKNVPSWSLSFEIKNWTKPGEFNLPRDRASDGASQPLKFHDDATSIEMFIQANGMLANVRFNNTLTTVHSLEAQTGVKDGDVVSQRGFDGRDGGMQSRSLVVLKNPYIHDFKFATYREESFFKLMEKAKAAGHDGVVFLNVQDPGGGMINQVESPMDNIYAVFPKAKNQVAYLDDTAQPKPAIRNSKQGGVFFSPTTPVTNRNEGQGWSRNEPELGDKIMRFLRETGGRQRTARELLEFIANAGGKKAKLAQILALIGDKEGLDTPVHTNSFTGGQYTVDDRKTGENTGRRDEIWVGSGDNKLVEMAALEEIIHALTTRKLLEETGDLTVSDKNDYTDTPITRGNGIFDTPFKNALKKVFTRFEQTGVVDFSGFDRGYGGTFSPQGWNRSKDFIVLAFAHYQVAKKLKETNPELYKTKYDRYAGMVMEKDLTPDEFVRLYRAKDFSEFVAGVLLDKQVQEAMKGMKNPFKEGRITDFFRYIIDAVARTLGISTKGDSLYQAAIQATINIASRDRAVSSKGGAYANGVLDTSFSTERLNARVKSGDLKTKDDGSFDLPSTIDTPGKRRDILGKLTKFKGDEAPGNPKVVGSYSYRGDMTMLVREGAYTTEFNDFVNDGESSNRKGSPLLHVALFDKDGNQVGYAEGQRDFGLYGLNVDEKHREKGIATDLLRAWARENGETDYVHYMDESPGVDDEKGIDGATSKALRKALVGSEVNSPSNGWTSDNNFSITKKTLEALDQWAKETLSPKRMNSLNPELIAALIYQTAREMGKGIANFASWLKTHTANLGKFLKQSDFEKIWGRAVQLARRPYDWATLRYFTNIADKAWQIVDRAEQDEGNGVGPNSSALRTLANSVFPRPGINADATSQSVPSLIKETRTKLSNYYSGILKRFADEFSQKTPQQMRDWEINFIKAVRGKVPMPGGALGQAVREYRALMKAMRLEMKSVGIDIGDQGETYFPRVMNKEAIAADEQGFIQAAVEAFKAYDIRQGNQPKTDPEYEKAAQYWLERELTGADEEEVANIFHGSQDSNSADFLKTRKFDENEAAFLDRFYSNDLDRITHSYIARASKLIEIARRFGADGQVFKKLMGQLQKDQIPKETRDEIARYVRQAVGAGVERHGNGTQIFLDFSNVLTALVFMGKSGLNNLVEGVSFGGRTLNPLDALRGPVMTWAYLARQLGEVSPAKQQAIQRMKGKKVGLKKALNQVIAEQLGLIHSEMERSYISAHWDYMDQDNGSEFARWLINKVYKANLTNATEVAKRNASIGLARLALRDNAKFLQGTHKLQLLFKRFGFNVEAKESVKVMFRENGIPDAFHAQFATWVSSLDGLDDSQYYAKIMSNDPMAGLYRQALARMSEGMAVQSSRALKPEFQDHAIGKQLLQLQNFNYAFGSVMNNRMWGIAKAAITPGKDRTAFDRIRYGVAAAVTAALSTAAFYGLKELYSYLFPSDGWDERKKKSDEEKALDALSYAGWLGPKFESVYKTIRRGQAPGGPFVSAIVEGAKTVGDYFSNDTASADRRMAKLGWNMGVKPVMVGTASAMGGPVGIAGTIAGTMSGPRDSFVDQLAGPKPDKSKGENKGGGR